MSYVARRASAVGRGLRKSVIAPLIAMVASLADMAAGDKFPSRLISVAMTPAT